MVPRGPVDFAGGRSCRRWQGRGKAARDTERSRSMGSIRVTLWVSLDGVVQGLGRADEDTRGGFKHGGWGQGYNDEGWGREMPKGMPRPGSMLCVRRTWQDFITAWG